MSNPKIFVFIAMSLDGFIAKKDGDIEWLNIVNKEAEDYGFNEFYNSIDTIIMGRNTYEKVLTFPDWPFQGKKVIVLTQKKLISKFGEDFFSNNESQLIEKLKKENSKNIYLDGGAVISSFLDHNLIDELRVSIIPILLGNGIPLFSIQSSSIKLKLQKTIQYETGLVHLIYKVK